MLKTVASSQRLFLSQVKEKKYSKYSIKSSMKMTQKRQENENISKYTFQWIEQIFFF